MLDTVRYDKKWGRYGAIERGGKGHSGAEDKGDHKRKTLPLLRKHKRERQATNNTNNPDTNKPNSQIVAYYGKYHACSTNEQEDYQLAWSPDLQHTNTLQLDNPDGHWGA